MQIATHDQENAASFSDDRQDFGGQAVQMKVRLTAGDHWISVAIPLIYEGLPARFGGPKPSTRPEHTCRSSRRRPTRRRSGWNSCASGSTTRRPSSRRFRCNGVRVSAVEIGGPYSYAKGPSRASLEKVYTCGHLDGRHQATCTPRIMTDLARRRVPPSGHDARGREVHHADRAAPEGGRTRSRKGSRSESRRCWSRRTSCSASSATAPSPRPAASYRITPHELATRLSYFLWASMPDAELRRAADAGTLRDPQILAFQVRRMLRDPKAHALAEHFGGQWLQFRALESLTRDRDKFPEFEDYLRLSMRRETELFVETIVRDDRSVLDFINGRYSFLNERLARHYGIPNVSGPQFRQVDLTGTPRGGVLTQGSVLAVSSYATRTSPVLRGKWVLDNLLNAPPPEPPADVPNLDESNIGTAASMREQLEEHRKNAICASCHRRMDPLGFGLENFDAVGAWRTMEGKFPIDASGQLPDGRTFTGPDELRDDPVGRSRRVRARHHVEAADLRAGPRPRALRHADGQAHRQPAAELRLQVLGPRARDRQQPAVPVAPSASWADRTTTKPTAASSGTRRHRSPTPMYRPATLVRGSRDAFNKERQRHDRHAQASAPPHVSEGHGRRRRAADARRDDAGVGRGRPRPRRRRCAWPSPTCRTASSWPTGRRRPPDAPSSTRAS